MMRPRSAGAKAHTRVTKPATPRNYQTMITGPRDPASNGMEPKLDHSQLSLSANGIAYKLIDSADEGRYRVLAEEGT